jgi:LysM repeat protein
MYNHFTGMSDLFSAIRRTILGRSLRIVLGALLGPSVLAGTVHAQQEEPPPAHLVIYHVHPGDSLYQIADRYDIGLRAILRHNTITNPNILTAGQALRLPIPEPVLVVDGLRTGGTIASPLAIGGYNAAGATGPAGRQAQGHPLVVVRIYDESWQLLGGALADIVPATATWQVEVPFWLPEPGWGYVEIGTVDLANGRERNTITYYVFLAGDEHPPDRFYRVKVGDNLTAIARQFGASVDGIRILNRISDSNRIRSDTLLIIPDF